MKIRIAAFLVAVAMLVTLSACGDTATVKEDSSAEREESVSEIYAEVTSEAESEIETETETTTQAVTTEYTTRKQPKEVYVYDYYTDPDRPEEGMLPVTYNGDDLIIYVNMPESKNYYQEGIFVMIDGVRQDIRVEIDGKVSEKTQMYIYNSTSEVSGTLKIHVQPNIGKKGDTVYMMLCKYSYPTYVPAEKMYTAASDGYNSDYISTMYPITVTMNCDASEQTLVCSDYSGMTVGEYDSAISSALSQRKLAVALGLESACVSATPRMTPDGVFYHNALSENKYMEWGTRLIDRDVTVTDSENETLNVVFYENINEYTGELEGEYRVSLYIDHELMNVFDGCSYADIRLEKGKQTLLTFDIDASDLPEYSRCYIILTKLDSNEYVKYDCRLINN